MASPAFTPNVRRSTRNAAKPKADHDLLAKGYADFDTKESRHNDGEQACAAQIRTTDGSHTWTGSTGTGSGHAEMDALHQILHACDYDAAVFDQLSLEVICESKPCCMRCSAILGLLGVSASGKTYKTPKGMGSTEWGLHYSVRSFLAKKLQVSEDSISSIGSCSL